MRNLFAHLTLKASLGVVASDLSLDHTPEGIRPPLGWLSVNSSRVSVEGRNLDLLKQMEPVVQRGIQAGRGQEDLLRLQVEIGKQLGYEAIITNFPDRFPRGDGD